MYLALWPLLILQTLLSCNNRELSKPNNKPYKPFNDYIKPNKIIKGNPLLKQAFWLEDNAQISGEIRCGYLDKNGVLWFGTNTGIYYYHDHSFTKLSVNSKWNDIKVLSIIEDNHGDLLFGGHDGLLKYDRNSIYKIPIPFQDTSSVWLDKVYPIINPNAVSALYLDKKDRIWIGTGGGGAYEYNGTHFMPILADGGQILEDSLHHNWITSITEDDNGNIWFSSMTRGGATTFNGHSFTNYMPKDGLNSDMVRTIFKDSKGNIWFGYKMCRTGGLTSFNGKTFKNYYKEDGLCIQSIFTIYEDKNKHLWFGGNLSDLCIFDGQSFTTLTQDNGEIITDIFTIIEDKNNHIWMGGKYGLWKYDGIHITEIIKY